MTLWKEGGVTECYVSDIIVNKEMEEEEHIWAAEEEGMAETLVVVQVQYFVDRNELTTVPYMHNSGIEIGIGVVI